MIRRRPRQYVLLAAVCDCAPPRADLRSAQPVAQLTLAERAGREILARALVAVAVSALVARVPEQAQVDALLSGRGRRMPRRHDPRMHPYARLAYAIGEAVPAQLVLVREGRALPSRVEHRPLARQRADGAARRRCVAVVLRRRAGERVESARGGHDSPSLRIAASMRRATHARLRAEFVALLCSSAL